MKTLLALVLAGGYLVVSELDFLDASAKSTERREFRSFMSRNCVPSHPREVGVIEMLPNGRIRCTYHDRKNQKREATK